MKLQSISMKDKNHAIEQKEEVSNDKLSDIDDNSSEQSQKLYTIKLAE